MRGVPWSWGPCSISRCDGGSANTQPYEALAKRVESPGAIMPPCISETAYHVGWKGGINRPRHDDRFTYEKGIALRETC